MLDILNYNENKVKQGSAKCIHENSFGCPVDRLTFYEKVHGFEAFMQQNRRATTKAVHISINFHPDENLSEQKLQEIATNYMDKIGFGHQPYLVYQHFDAGHPHIHVVTTNIQRDGTRIILYNIGRNQSEKARKEIEDKYELVKASGRRQDPRETINQDRAQKLVYGKSETKRSIANVVAAVTRSYKYTSLPEFNAVLSQFNIVADRGSERSRMFQKRVLHYRALDNKGKKTGVPIKASSIYGKPTLAYLEKQFKINEEPRRPYRDRIIKCIEDCFGSKKTVTKSAFVQALSREGIYVLFRRNEEGRIYGITFVDNKAKVVFNGSDLGKAYGAKGITERLSNLTAPDPIGLQPTAIQIQSGKESEMDTGIGQAIEDLTFAKPSDFTSPDSAIRRRRRKKRSGLSI